MAPEIPQEYCARFVKRLKDSPVINNQVTRTLIARPAKSIGWGLVIVGGKLLLVPRAIAGGNSEAFDGSTEIFQQQFKEMHDVLDRLREFNTTSGMNEEDKERFNGRIDQAQAMNVTRLKMAEEILKMDEEEKIKAEEKLRKQLDSLKYNADNLEKENANAIIVRIFTALVGLDVLDVLDIAFSILKNFVDTNFASGVKNMVADESITGPLAKMAHTFRIDEFAGLLAQTPIIGDVNEGFTQFANSDYVSPFSSIIGQTMQSEAANLIFRALVIMNAVGQEVDLNNRYKEAHDNIDSAIPKMNEFTRDSRDNHIEKMAPKIIELNTKDELKHVYFKAFLEERDTPLNSIFSSEFLNTKMRNEDGTDSTISINDYLTNLKNKNASDDIKEDMKNFAKDPQNREIIEIILNTIEGKYRLDPNCMKGKEDILKTIITDKNKDLLERQFQGDGFKKSFSEEVHGKIKKGLDEGKSLNEAIMNLEGKNIDNAIVAIAKIVKHDEMVIKIKTTAPKQTWVDKVMAADSVTEAIPASRAR